MSTATDAQPLLRAEGVVKRFGPVEALAGVDFEVHAGEVVALVGDNGAGKSTFIKTVSGVGPADAGTFTFAGEQVRLNAPQDASRLGIASIYQDLALSDNLDIVENLFLGREESPLDALGPLAPMDDFSMEHQARGLLKSLSVKLPSIRAEVGTLSGGQRQSVAIARALLGEPKMVILDEPTAALGVEQTAQVLALVTRLKERGLAVVLISHNMGDVFQVADRVVVLRLGRNAGVFAATDENRSAVVSAITGAQERRAA